MPGLAETYKQGGKYLGLPNDTTFGMPLFYDVDLLQQSGIARPPTDWMNPWSWAQFTDAAQKLTRAYGAPNATYGVTVVQQLQVMARLGGIELYSSAASQTGLAKPADYHADAPEVLAGVQAVYDLIYKDKVSPTPPLASQISANKVDPFGAQRLAMNRAGGFEYWQYKSTVHSFKWAPAADPKLNANTATNFTDPWMLSSKSADPARRPPTPRRRRPGYRTSRRRPGCPSSSCSKSPRVRCSTVTKAITTCWWATTPSPKRRTTRWRTSGAASSLPTTDCSRRSSRSTRCCRQFNSLAPPGGNPSMRFIVSQWRVG